MTARAIVGVLWLVFMAVWARFHLGRNWGMPMSVQENAELVTSGPYAYVRNPIYSGILLAMLGSAIVTGPWWLVILVIAGTHFVYSAKQEEALLVEQFPGTFQAYRARTKMLIRSCFRARSRALREHHVRRRGRRHVGRALVAEGVEVEAVEEMFAGAEQRGRDGHVQLVDEPGLQVLAYRRDAAADLHVLSCRRLRCALECLA